MAKQTKSEKLPQLVGYLVQVEDGGVNQLHFLHSDLEEPVVMKLLRYVAAVYEFHAIRVLGWSVVGMNPAIQNWEPDRISSFIDPKSFNDDEEGKFWCLLHKDEALALYGEWVKDPRYQGVDRKEEQNYFKNRVDLFKQKVEERYG